MEILEYNTPQPMLLTVTEDQDVQEEEGEILLEKVTETVPAETKEDRRKRIQEQRRKNQEERFRLAELKRLERDEKRKRRRQKQEESIWQF